MSRDGVPWERGPGSDGEGARSPQMSPDQRREELPGGPRALTVNTEPPEVISLPFQPLTWEAGASRSRHGPGPQPGSEASLQRNSA